MSKTITSTSRFVRLVASERFFWLVVGLLVLQAAWIALTGRYPMAFDEDFHLGIIRLYAHHISPFWSGQPPGADAFGAVARDPSYLYHYLMSFPYRLITVFTHDQTIQVLWLRAIDIGLFASGLVVYRRLLLKTGTSRAVVHACLLAFVLIPVVPLLAAQINYDNLLIPLTGLILLLTVNLSNELRHSRRINVKGLLVILILCLLASLVKYAFLPMFAALALYLIASSKRSLHSFRKVWRALITGTRQLSRRSAILLVVLLILSGGLFVERYGINLVRYHTPIPDCSKVLSVSECSAYGPWIRDYNFSLNKVDEEHNPAVFTADWLYGMWLRLFFAVDGPGTDFQTRGPLTLPGASSIVFIVASTLLLIRYARRIFWAPDASVLRLFALVTIFYVGALWLDNYRAYVRTGQPVAINGRYLLPVMLIILLVAALAFGELLKRRPRLKPALASVAIIGLVWGGGALTYILRSNDAWYWPSQPVRDANHAVQNVFRPITPGSARPTELMSWQ